MGHFTESIPADKTVGSGNGWSKRARASASDADIGAVRRPRSRSADAAARATNEERLAYARLALEEMVLDAICHGRTGTLGIEIPVKEGRLGRVKRLQVEFQPE